MDILSLPKTKTDIKLTIDLTECNSKLTKAIPIKKMIVTDVAKSLVKDWALPYGILEALLTDSGSQFVGSFIYAASIALSGTQMKTAAYHPQTNEQTERFNKTIFKPLCH